MEKAKSFFIKNKLILGIIAGLLLAALIVAVSVKSAPENTRQTESEKPAPMSGKIVISEFMPKNKGCFMDEDGDFPDWIELHNISGESVDLGGWSLSDDEGKTGWVLPEISLEADERIVVFASGKDRAETLHTDFSLSQGEKVCLYDVNGSLVMSGECGETQGEGSFCLNDEGNFEKSLYPTPGFENSADSYELFQNTLEPKGSISINEVAVSSFDQSGRPPEGRSDWVEVKNLSDESIELSGFYLTDNLDKSKKYPLPDRLLMPGEIAAVYPDEEQLSLDSYAEELYLVNSAGEIIDYAFLRDIPYNCSYGRVENEKGWFYISRPTPDSRNIEGDRRVSQMPVLVSGGGVSEGVDRVKVELSGDGEIHYTTDGSRPNLNSPLYNAPVEMTETGVIRAACFEEGAMSSRVLDVSCIINEGHSLPVLSLVSDNRDKLHEVYSNGDKWQEVPASISYYDADGTFTMPCGIEMHGFSSLILEKKNMSLKFRGAYGAETLNYDIFGGGVTEFHNLLLRGGQDQIRSIIKNELCQNLCLQASDAVISQRSKYCVLYVDGKYNGIYAIMEKPNAAHYSTLAGVSKESVELIDANPYYGSNLYNDVYNFCYYNDMSLKENYDKFCAMMDVDSLVDWMILEGYFCNKDLGSGNLKFCRSPEADGKWRLIFYDLDSTFSDPYDSYDSIFSSFTQDSTNISSVILRLLKNQEFKDKLAERGAELFNSVLTDESVIAEIDRLTGIIAPEVPRDHELLNDTVDSWQWNIEYLKALFTEKDWHNIAVNRFCNFAGLSDEQRARCLGQ